MYLPDGIGANYLKGWYGDETHYLIETKINGVVLEYQYVYNSNNQKFTLCDSEGNPCGDTYLTFPTIISTSNPYGEFDYGSTYFIKVPTDEPT